MKVFQNLLAQKIYDILHPLIGDAMAKSAIKRHALSAGCDAETIKHKDLSQLAEGIRKGLTIFIGTDTASKVATKISQLT